MSNSGNLAQSLVQNSEIFLQKAELLVSNFGTELWTVSVSVPGRSGKSAGASMACDYYVHYAASALLPYTCHCFEPQIRLTVHTDKVKNKEVQPGPPTLNPKP